jgi:hypothetical protein
MGKAEGKRPLEKPRRRCEDSIKSSLQESGWKVVEAINLAQGKEKWRGLVNRIIKIGVP